MLIFLPAIGQVKEEPVAFVDHYYSWEMYLKAYKYIIYPVNGPELWESLDEPGLLPLVEINIGGRPTKPRKKGADEKEEIKNSKKRKGHVQSQSRVGNMKLYACRECKQVGHNKRTCPTKIASSSSAANSASKPLVQQPIQLPAKKAKKAHTCTTCKQPGHNMATCRKKISDRYADDSQDGETDANQYD